MPDAVVQLNSMLGIEVQRLKDSPDEKPIINKELADRVSSEFNKCLQNEKEKTLFFRTTGILGSVCIISASYLFLTASSSFIAVAFLVSGIGAIYIWNKYSNLEGEFANLAANVMKHIHVLKQATIKPEQKHEDEVYIKKLEEIAIEAISKGADIDALVYGGKGIRSPKSLLSWAALSGQHNIVLYLAMIMSNRNKKEKNEKLFSEVSNVTIDEQIKKLLIV